MCLGDAAFMAYRDGDSDWLTPSRGSSKDEWDICVDDDYVAIAVYENSNGGFRQYQVASSVNESNFLSDWCVGSRADWDRREVGVNGQMLQPGSVQMDGCNTASQSAPWNFGLTIASGSHDLVAYSADNRVLVRRGIEINDTTSLPTVDIDAEGVAFASVPLTIEGLLADESVTTSVELWTNANDLATLPDTKGAVATMLPSELRHSGDRQWLELLVTTTAGFFRGAYADFSGTETSFALLPRLETTVTYQLAENLVASWGALPVPDYSAVTLVVHGGEPATVPSMHFARASRGWLERHGAQTLNLDFSAPAYADKWKLDLTRPYRRTFSVERDVDRISYWTSASEMLNGTTPLQSPPDITNTIRAQHSLRFRR